MTKNNAPSKEIMEVRHEKVAQLLVIFWDCNLSDSDIAKNWTSVGMESTVCNPIMTAIRAILVADYPDPLPQTKTLREDFVNVIVERLLDNYVSKQQDVSIAVLETCLACWKKPHESYELEG